MQMFCAPIIYLTPLIPLSTIWICIPIMRGNLIIREASPLSDSLYCEVNYLEVLENCAPLKKLPPPW